MAGRGAMGYPATALVNAVTVHVVLSFRLRDLSDLALNRGTIIRPLGARQRFVLKTLANNLEDLRSLLLGLRVVCISWFVCQFIAGVVMALLAMYATTCRPI